MTSQPAGLALNGAVSQYDRWRRALDGGYAKVDGRTYADLLGFAVEYGALIRYYDLSDRPDGDWVPFFVTDPAMLLASLQSLDTPAIEREYTRLQRATRAERVYDRKFELLRATFAAILDLARRVDRWLRLVQTMRGAGADAIRSAIVAAVDESLRDALGRLKAYDEGAGLPDALRQAIGLDYAGFLPIWDLGCICPDGSIYRGATRQRKIDHALPALDPLFYAFFDFVVDLQALAAAELPVAFGTGDHKPQIALYMAFARLFRTAQETINSFSSRYSDFYYRRVLREPEAPALPDSVYLTFTLAAEENVTQTTVPRGTLFVGGQDSEGNDLLYAADRSLAVTAATISALRTLRRIDEPLFDDVPARVVAAEIPPDVDTPWPPFGTAADAPAELGFQIASPYLLLTGGDRRVEITFWYDDVELEGRLQYLSDLTGIPCETILLEVLRRAFRLQATTAEGWLDIAAYGVRAGFGWFAIDVELPAGAPALVMFDTPHPTLKAWLIQEPVSLSPSVSVYPLSLLATMRVGEIEIYNDVKRLADLRLANTDGEIDPTAPFPLFGAIPVVGSYVELQSAELFSKRPETLSILVDWFNLPQNDDGFAGWYRDWVVGLDGKVQSGLFDNQTFLGEFEVVDPGWWDVDADVYLFRTTGDCGDPVPDPRGALCSTTGFDNLDVVELSPPDPYYEPLNSALRLELTSPPYAFGNSIYAQNVLRAVIKDLPDPAACQQKCLALCGPLRSAADAIARCLERAALSPPQGSLRACLGGVASSLLDASRRCQQRCREVSPPDEGCFRRCLKLAEMAWMIGDCLQPSPPQPIEECARECRRKLEQAYASCLQRCMEECADPKKDLRYPNEPYFPTATDVRADYTARSTSVWFSYLLPFGGQEEVALPGTEPFPPFSPPPLLPEFGFEGTLWIGFSGMTTPQNVTLLYQTTTGAPPLAAPPPVRWEYLDVDRWTPLTQEQLLADGTYGLRGTGMLALAFPPFDSSAGTVAPGAQWIRATVQRDAGTFPRTVAVTPHVLTATWQAGPATGVHLARPLPAGTIASSVQDLPFIASIAQPVESFGGRPAEDRRAFEIRLGERLRHKDRAVLAWDYERLVLERFPTVWKCAALPDAPGRVLVVVVPGPASTDLVDPTVPSAPTHLLSRIRCYLETLTSPFVQLQVVNPAYVRIRVSATVSFVADAAAGGSLEQLNDDLVRYLSPWFYDAERAAKQGRYASEDDISAFIQTRPYVDTLQSIGFTYDPDPRSLDWYFLTSAADHQLREILPPPDDPCLTRGGAR